MKSYSIATFKAKISQILQEIFKGETILVTDHNRPVARVISVRRFRELSAFNFEYFLSLPPVKLPKNMESSAQLIRRIRDEE